MKRRNYKLFAREHPNLLECYICAKAVVKDIDDLNLYQTDKRGLKFILLDKNLGWKCPYCEALNKYK